jgi:SAM-dependent methyltransferase
VILAGPNGGGKSRLLHRILKIKNQSLELRDRFLSNKQHELCRMIVAGEECIDLSNGNGTVDQIDWEDGYPSFRHLFGIQIEGYIEGPLPVASFVPVGLELRNPDLCNREDRISAAHEARNLGLDSLGEHGICYIESVQSHWWDANHPFCVEEEISKQENIKRYETLIEIVNSLLGVKLGRDKYGRATIFGAPIATSKLSLGQKALLLWATGLHAQNMVLGNAILVMDEPENHLHPAALVEAVCKSIDANSGGQVWIATHSVPLIAALVSRYYNDVSLFFINEGRAMYAGREPEAIAVSLMGGSENLQAMRDFIDLPDQMAANRFAAECLLPPHIVFGARPADPQVKVVDKKMWEEQRVQQLLKVLDFGAGSGRLLEGLYAIHGNHLREKLEYVAWDVPHFKGERCLTTLRRVYHDNSCRRFTDRNALFRAHAPETFDRVVMCNVLHEIDPQKWLELFCETGIVYRSLKPDGCLIIIEDYLMPMGECAHSAGFLFLDTEALYALFGVTSEDDKIQVERADGKYRDRIRAHTIPRRLLKNVTSEKRTLALKLIRESAVEQIGKLRTEKEHTFRSGQIHAFWVQQLANTTLALNTYD